MNEDKQLDPNKRPEALEPEETPTAEETAAYPNLSKLDKTTTEEEKAPPAAEEKKEPTKFQRFMRKVLTWTIVVVLAFLAGVLTLYFVAFRPKAQLLDDTNAQLVQAQSQISTLEEDLADAEQQMETYQNEETHRILLAVMVDVYKTRLALSLEDTVAAKSALANTAAKLERISDKIAAFDTTLAETMPSRLDLIRANIEASPDDAMADSDLLIDDLKEVEDALFP